jgi:hypothetical protein
MTLAVLVIAAAVSVPTSTLPLATPLLPALGFVGYVLHVRRQARRLYEQKRRDQAIAVKRAELRRRAEAAVARSTERAAARSEPPRARPGTIHADGTWEPVRIPLPTYVTAPVVRRPPPARVVAVDGAGAWTSGHLTDLMSGFRGRPGVNAVTAFSSGAQQHAGQTAWVEADGDVTGRDVPSGEQPPRPRAANE